MKRSAVKKVRSKPRAGRLKGKALKKLRWECYERDGRQCVECGRSVPFDGDIYTRMHMAHIGAKRRHGDSLDNVRTLCFWCHDKEHNPKAVPAKPS